MWSSKSHQMDQISVLERPDVLCGNGHKPLAGLGGGPGDVGCESEIFGSE